MKRSFAVDDFVAFRTPVLPLTFLDGDALAEDGLPETDRREALRTRLRAAVALPEVREALFLASPTFEAALQPWLEDRLPPEKRSRMDQSVLRYLSRMASRATPFGLFAGSSTGVWAAETRLDAPGFSGYRRHTRLDMDFLARTAESLSKDPILWSTLRYRPNDALYEAAGQYRYPECHRSAEGDREFNLVALEPTEALRTVLARAKEGVTPGELAEALVDEDVDLDAAMAFIRDLADAQLLRPDLQASLTGTEALHSILDAAGFHPAAEILQEIQSTLEAMDGAGLGRPTKEYRDLAQRLEALPAAVETRHLFQVDLTGSRSDVRLGPAVREALEAGIELLQRITPPRRKDAFKPFRVAFQSRYEGRWVPLLEALDPESGIGFEEGQSTLSGELPLLEGLDFAAGDEPGRPFSSREAFLLRRLDALGHSQEWELTESDVEALTHGEPSPLPDSFAAMAILAAPAKEDLDAGRFQLLMEHYHGPSGVRLLGRFSSLDPELESRVRAHLEKEAALRPDAILAEVVHLPEGRSGNLVRRPRLRGWEISFLGAGAAHESHQIPLHDLQVTVVGDRVLLRSERLGREVRPRLSSAHNYAKGLGAYRFLGKLQDEDGHTGGWGWGCLEHRSFLPRVRRGRHVLARATWRVEAREIREVLAAPRAEAFLAFQAFRRARRLPRFVVLADLDRHLRVDLDHPLWVETLLQEVAKRAHFLLQESYPELGQLPARGPGGAYAHEVIVPFLRREPAASPGPATPPPLHGVVRRHAPGSEWLYLKLYSGARTADALLGQWLQPLLVETTDLWDRWHFLRHADPEPHLRVRFHGQPERLLGELLPRIHATLEPCLADGRCWRIQIDTYVPEWERYGGPRGLVAAEELFWRDSETVLRLLEASERNQGEARRWRLGLLAMDDLMARLGLGLEARVRLAGEVRDAFARELRAEEGLRSQLGLRFRAIRGSLEALLSSGSDPEAAGLLAARAERLGPALAILEDAETRGELSVTRANLAVQFNHMTLNRLFHSAQRAQEFVLYDFLSRLYRARYAQLASAGEPPQLEGSAHRLVPGPA